MSRRQGLRLFSADFPSAAVHFERAAEIQPRNYQPFTLLSEIHLVLGHPDRSATAARQAISCIENQFGRDPEVAEVLGMGAATLVYLGENTRAEK
jgi:adenylate cyclase